MDFKRWDIVFPIFHVALPLIILEIPYIKKNFRFNRIALIIGALLPDIIDKSLMFLNLGSGRGISHTLLFVVVSFLIIHFFVKRNFLVSIPFFIGCLSHLLLDLPEVPLFFPFVMYEFIYVDDPLNSWLYSLFNDPVVFITEISGLFILLFILINNQLYSGKKIINFLRNKPFEANKFNSK